MQQSVVHCRQRSADHGAALADWRGATGNGLKEEDQLLGRSESDARLRELTYRAEIALTTADALLGEAPAGCRSALIYLSDGYVAEARAADRLARLAAAAAARTSGILPLVGK